MDLYYFTFLFQLVLQESMPMLAKESGKITQILIRKGDQVWPGKPLLRINRVHWTRQNQYLHLVNL